AYRFQQASEASEYVTVGVNGYTMDEERRVETLRVPASVEEEQRARLASVRASRDPGLVAAGLEGVRRAARSGENIMPPVIEAVRASCSVGEISGIFRDEFGVYDDPGWF
ncbi:MAG: methylmalonyl-CoA mutase family protein, partial [Candidatus Binatia bacterium]